jgi:Leucine-rich repeat (LRR) protein
MKKLYPLLSVLFLIYWGCLDPLNIFDSNDEETVEDETVEDETVEDETVNLWGVDYSIENTTVLDLSNSGLTGSIPPEIGNLTNLTYLRLDDNQLTGEIPSEIGYLTKLDDYEMFSGGSRGLFLSNNQLSGEIPESICYFSFSVIIPFPFSITNNQLCPPYPSCVEPYVGEQDISNCWDCEQDGVVELWGNCYSIEYTTEINLFNKGLTGSIPSEIGNLTNLTNLNLRSNQLTGSIPPEIGNLTNLTELFLRSNELTGSIPSEIGNLTNLTYLLLYNNQLTGSIPPEIGNLTNLISLNLSDNQLTGIIPDEICNQGDSSPGLSNNQLCPPYPSCIEDYVGEQDTSGCD